MKDSNIMKVAAKARFSPPNITSTLISNCKKRLKKYTPAHQIVVKDEPVLGKNNNVGSVIGVAYKKNEGSNYCIWTYPTLSAPTAELGIAKKYETGGLYRNPNDVLIPSHLAIQKLIKAKPENDKTSTFKLAIPIATNSLLREHWMGLFIKIDYDETGASTVTAELVDSQNNPIAHAFYYKFLEQAIKKIFSVDLKYVYLGQQELNNFTDCGNYFTENTMAFFLGRDFNPNLKFEVKEKPSMLFESFQSIFSDDTNKNDSTVSHDDAIADIPIHAMYVYDHKVEANGNNIVLEANEISKFEENKIENEFIMLELEDKDEILSPILSIKNR